MGGNSLRSFEAPQRADATSTRVGTRGRRWTIVSVAVVSVLASCAVTWAAATVFAAPQASSVSDTYTTATVRLGRVESSISLNVAASWTKTLVASNLASGTVTSVVMAQGAELETGSILYTVDLRPVVVAEGQVPAFRDIAAPLKGADVSQLQAMLTHLGLYDGKADGEAGTSTVNAIKRWQKALGVEPDGVVHRGDLVFVPSLPARLTLDPSAITVGKAVGGGEPAIFGLPGSPTFTAPVAQSQAAAIPAGAEVEITAPSGQTWTAVAGSQATSSDTPDTTVVELSGLAGGPICGEECGSVPTADKTLLPSRAITVKPTSGMVVPSAALSTRANGTITVTDAKGQRHVVTVVAAAQGTSVITGVPEGLHVRIPVTS
jgi:peptidoglycan hydrolase-like protein with peptidoglycan-binding domain